MYVIFLLSLNLIYSISVDVCQKSYIIVAK